MSVNDDDADDIYMAHMARIQMESDARDREQQELRAEVAALKAALLESPLAAAMFKELPGALRLRDAEYDALRAENDRLRDAIMTMAAHLRQYRSAESAIWAIREAANDKGRTFTQELIDEKLSGYSTKMDELREALREACDLYDAAECVGPTRSEQERIVELRKLTAADDAARVDGL